MLTSESRVPRTGPRKSSQKFGPSGSTAQTGLPSMTTLSNVDLRRKTGDRNRLFSSQKLQTSDRTTDTWQRQSARVHTLTINKTHAVDHGNCHSTFTNEKSYYTTQRDNARCSCGALLSRFICWAGISNGRHRWVQRYSPNSRETATRQSTNLSRIALPMRTSWSVLLTSRAENRFAA